MKLPEAIAAIQVGQRVTSPAGSEFWLEQDAKGRPRLMALPHGFSKPVKHVVIASEHFTDEEWL